MIYKKTKSIIQQQNKLKAEIPDKIYNFIPPNLKIYKYFKNF